jgi:hypothetical protein
VPAGSLIAIFEGPGQQRVVAFRPGSAQPIPLAHVEPPLPGATFAFGGSKIFAVQPDGGFWTVEADGQATRQGELGVAPGPMTWDASAKALLMLSGNDLVRIDPLALSPLRTVTIAAEGFEACGITRGAGGYLFVAEQGTGELFRVRLDGRGGLRDFEPLGEVPASGCLMTVARRR